MFKAIIIDSKEDRVEFINKLLSEYYPQIELISVFGNPTKALQVINELNPDLVIIKGSYPNQGAFKFLEKISYSFFQCIFLFDSEIEYKKSIEFKIDDYCIGQILENKFKDLIHKSILKMTERYISNQKEIILLSSRNFQYTKKNKIAIPIGEGLVFMELDNLIRLEAQGSYTIIYISNKEKVLASRNIKEFEEILSSTHFFRIHNSHIVNLNRIIKYNKGRGGTLTMDDGSQIEVASRRKTDFLNIFQ
jgi:two-component system LytT family response regulator